MSIISNLYQGLSGLKGNSLQMEVVGNNIANLNTVGFKEGRANFEEVLGRTVMGSSYTSRMGAGARVSNTEQLFGQGSFASTGQATDLAIGGEGFFVVKGDVGGVNGNFFSRAGQFRTSAEGYLTTGNGLRVQGFPAGADGIAGSQLGDLKLPQGPLDPVATDAIDLVMSLQSDFDSKDVPFDVTDPDNTSDHSTTVSMFDSLGNSHEVTVYLNKTANNEWSYNAVVEGAETEGGTPGLSVIGTGTLSFTTDGKLQTETGAPLSVTFEGAAAQSISLDFGTSIDEGGDGSEGSKQVETRAHQALLIEQNGSPAGTLQGIRVDNDGTVLGAYSNGEELSLGKVAVARFQATSGLESVGGNMFRATGQSGEALIGEANNGGRGAIFGGTLEQSNVDLATQFVNLISAQRGYQANARTITTADEVYAETVNLK